YSGEAAQAFRFIAINLCEPLITTLFTVLPASAIITTVVTSANPFLQTSDIIATVVTSPGPFPFSLSLPTILPMVILLAPVRGIHFQDPMYRKLNRRLLLLGMIRLCLNVFIVTTMAAALPIGALGLPIAITVYVLTIAWGIDLVSGSYAPFVTPTTLSSSASTTAPAQVSPAEPTLGASGTPTTQLQLPDLSTAIWCAVCHTPTALDADHCHLCGLVFASRLPNNLPIPAPYTLIRPLATGGLSHVYLARDTTTDQLVVLKTLASIDAPQPPDWHTDAHVCLTHEAQLLRTLEHPGLPHVHTWLPDKHTPLLVLEHIVGPTLEQTITVTDTTGQLVGTKPLSIVETLGYAHGIAQTLVYLADQPHPIVHGDLKPANLIAATDRPIPVLLDFGSATRLEGNGPTTVPQRYGTPGFAAPEQYHGQVTRTSDVYGLGATLYQLLTADDPSTHPLHFPALDTLPFDLATLLTTMLDRDPDQRPTPAALEVQLQTSIMVFNSREHTQTKQKV
ncbi:MAG: serine/threonine-protein kinase, partial [Chloroflexota bacterium]